MADLKKEIRNEIAMVFREWDLCDVSTLQDSITDDVEKDVFFASDYPNYNISDIRTGIKRVVMCKVTK